MYYNAIGFDWPQSIVDAFADSFALYCPGTSFDVDFMKSFDSYNFLGNDLFFLPQNMVLKAAESLKSDGIPSFIIRYCASILVHPLNTILNLALKTGIFPIVWKKAKIVPVYKVGK